MKIYKFLIFFIWSSSVFAYDVDLNEFNMLPPWCKAKYADMYNHGKVEGISINPDRYKVDVWNKRIGKAWIHFHHYCPGIVKILSVKYGTYRKYGKTPTEVLSRANGGIEYTITHSQLNSKNSWLFADAKMWLGKIAELEKNTGTAVQFYNESIATYKKYIPAYIALSDLYEDQGNYRKAIDWIDNALKLKPRSRLLKSKKKRLKEKLK